MQATVSLIVTGDEAVIEIVPEGPVNRQILTLAIQGKKLSGFVHGNKEGTFQIKFDTRGEVKAKNEV